MQSFDFALDNFLSCSFLVRKNTVQNLRNFKTLVGKKTKKFRVFNKSQTFQPCLSTTYFWNNI